MRGAVLLRFGNCNNGAHDGVRARNWNNTATNANWNIGFAVFLPNVGRTTQRQPMTYTADG